LDGRRVGGFRELRCGARQRRRLRARVQVGRHEGFWTGRWHLELRFIGAQDVEAMPNPRDLEAAAISIPGGRKSGSAMVEMEDNAGMWAPSVRYRGGGTARSDREQGMASVARGRAPAAAGSGTRKRMGQPGPLRPC
jgi:hypothetical protein